MQAKILVLVKSILLPYTRIFFETRKRNVVVLEYPFIKNNLSQ